MKLIVNESIVEVDNFEKEIISLHNNSNFIFLGYTIEITKHTVCIRCVTVEKKM